MAAPAPDASAVTEGPPTVTQGTPTVTVLAGADARGQGLKDSAVAYLRTKPGVSVLDLGTDSYYAIAERVAETVAQRAAGKAGSGLRAGGQRAAGEAGGEGGSGGEGAGERGERGGGVTSGAAGALVVPGGEVRGLLVCGTGAGVAMVANKIPGVSSACCGTPGAAQDARSINNCNVLSLGALHTSLDQAPPILDAFLATKFKDPCPASKGEAWSDEVASFLDASLPGIAAVGAKTPGLAPGVPEGKGQVQGQGQEQGQGAGEGKGQAEGVPEGEGGPGECPICDLAAGRALADVAEMPGGAWRVIRESPTTAVVSFKAGSIEPAHHHTFGHDVMVLSCHKSVQNLSTAQTFALRAGDFLSTPAGHVHRVYYHSDTEFFIKWDGPCDILLDESLETARGKIAEIFP